MLKSLRIGEVTIIHGSKLKVLLVEDDGVLRMLVKEKLKTLGYDVIDTESSKEAMKMFNGIDILVTDYNLLPGEPKGIEVARAAKKHGIFTVSHSSEKPNDPAYDMVFEKPFGWAHFNKIKEAYKKAA